ncbi:MAG: TonB-dependent receptor [Rubrivivax sp.]|nr:TonB-dependent receptor [Rubrivivax sp.]
MSSNSLRSRPFHFLLASSTAIGSIAVLHGARAQGAAAPAAGDAETLVVTAQRRIEPLQEVPLSVITLSGAQLQNAGVTSADRLEQLVPSLRMGRSGSDLRPAMRGTYTENVAANGDPRFGIYIDDIYQSRTSQVPPIVDLARVEVQKGPQGTLYGRNSFGGNIVFHSALPTEKFDGGINLMTGNYTRYRAEGYLNLPLGEGIGLRLAGLTEDNRGYVKNIGSGNDYGGEDQKFLRGTLRIAPHSFPDLEVVLRASHLSLGGEGLGGFGYKILGTLVDPSMIRAPGESLTYNGVTYALPNGFNGNSWTGVGMPIDTRYRDGIADVNGADIGIPTVDDPYKVNYAGNIFRKGAQNQYGATVSLDVGPVRLRSITSYTDFDVIRTGGSLTPVLLNYSYAQTTARTLTQELQIMSGDATRSPFEWIAGLYYFNDTARDRGVTNVNRGYVTATAPAGQQYYPFGFTYMPSGAGFNQTAAYDSFGAQEQKTKSLAAYGQLSYTLNNLTLTAGLRRTRDDKDVLASRFNMAATGPGAYFAHSIDDPVDYACGGYIAANAASVSQSTTAVQQAYNFVCASKSYSYSTYRFAADYKLDRERMVYASYSTGTHAGGFNTGPVSINGVPTLLPFAPEYVKAFEIGTKNTLFNRTLTLNAAAFLNDYRDLQAQTSIPNPNAPLTSVIALVQNIGKDRAYGIDLDAVLRPTKDLRMSLAYNWLDAKEIEYAVNTFNFGGTASFCGITPSCVAASGEANTVQGTPFPNARTDPNRFVPVLDANGNQVVSGGVPQYRYVIAGAGRDGTRYTSKKAFSPKVTIQFGIAYDIGLGGAGTLTPEIQTYYNSGYILTDLTPDYGKNDAYTKTDLRITYRTHDGKFSLQAFVNNIEDKAIITRAAYTNHRALLVNYAPSRTYGLSGSYRF